MKKLDNPICYNKQPVYWDAERKEFVGSTFDVKPSVKSIGKKTKKVAYDDVKRPTLFNSDKEAMGAIKEYLGEMVDGKIKRDSVQFYVIECPVFEESGV